MIVLDGRGFDWVAGTGGIGSGMTVRLVGDATLGREESRAVEVLDSSDRCKLHIVLHYVQRLLGPGYPVLPFGAVGDDPAGAVLLDELAATGMVMAGVRVIPQRPTLFAVAFGYPDGDGGNLTAVGSASDAVAPGDMQLERDGRGLVVALPEVPLDARAELLRQGAGQYRVASFVTGELPEALERSMLDHVDLLALNADEARVVAGSDPLIDGVIATLAPQHPTLSIVVTNGAAGSWSWDGSSVEHARVDAPAVVSTAGAGDAHLGGILTALALGSGLHEANRLGALVSALKVGGTHAINHAVDGDAVRRLHATSGVRLDDALLARLA